MNIKTKLKKVNSLFIDTAPLIYYIEGHAVFENLISEIIDFSKEQNIRIQSSVITLTEVLIKPHQTGNKLLVNKFLKFFSNPNNIVLTEINFEIAEKAGRLRGTYPSLKTVDSLQIASALFSESDIFLTNDKQLKKIKEIKSFVLSDNT